MEMLSEVLDWGAKIFQLIFEFMPEFTAIGKVPAWINYMTNFNKVYGNFATEIPRYEGGLSKEIIFQEITSFYGSSEENPLGTLAGRGTLSQKHKGGKSIIRVNEPCYVMGIVSITPRIDYSQGNDWAVNLLTLDDLHKPQLDEIGFQDLLLDLMSASTTQTDIDFMPKFTAIGTVPAWLNYMTNFNKVYGNFADPRSRQTIA